MRLCLAVLCSVLWLSAPAPAQEAKDDGFAKGYELFRAGRYEAALPYFQRELDLAEARYGADDPEVAVEVNNLAEVYRQIGRLDEAEALYQRAIELDARAGRADDPSHATSLNNLALIYRAQDRLDEAERLYLRSLDLLERTVGSQHADVAKSLNNLATLYRLQGKLEQARPLQARALAVAEKSLGDRHPTTLHLKDNLAKFEPAPPVQPAVPKPKPTTVAAAAPSSAPEPAAGPSPAASNGRAAAPGRGGGTFTVQVAAIRERDGAAAELRRLTRRHPVLVGLEALPAEEVQVRGKGTFYRVFAGAFATKADADAVCAQLMAQGSYCQTRRR